VRPLTEFKYPTALDSAEGQLTSKGVSRVLIVALLPALLLAAPFQSTMAASNSACDTTDCWETGAGHGYQLGGYSALGIPYLNTSNSTVTGVVFMVIHNYPMNQTIEISTATLQLAAGANGTAYLIQFGLASGMYQAIFFVVEPSGVAISSTVTLTFLTP